MDREEFAAIHPMNDEKFCYPCEFDKPIVYLKPKLDFTEAQKFFLNLLSKAEEAGIDLFPSVRSRVYKELENDSCDEQC